MAKTKLYYYIK